MSKKNLRKISFPFYCTLEEAVNILLNERKKGVHAYGIFNEHVLKSDNITLDNAYIEVFGYSKEEYLIRLEKFLESSKKTNEDIKRIVEDNTSYLIKTGYELIYPNKHDEWNELVNISKTDPYYGLILLESIQLMKLLNKTQDMEEAKNLFEEQGHSAFSENIELNIIYNFSKKGLIFLKYLYGNEIPSLQVNNKNLIKKI